MGAWERGWEEAPTNAPHCVSAQPWARERVLQVSGAGRWAHLQDRDSDGLETSHQQPWKTDAFEILKEGTQPNSLKSEGCKCSHNDLYRDVIHTDQKVETSQMSESGCTGKQNVM